MTTPEPNVMASTKPAPKQVFRMVDSRTPASQTKDARGASGGCGCGGCGCGGKGKKRKAEADAEDREA